MKNKKTINRLLTISIVVVALACLGFLLYNPAIEFINALYMEQTVSIYDEKTQSLTEEKINTYIKDAEKYNNNLKDKVSIQDRYSEESSENQYSEILNISGNGVIGVVTVPSVNIDLPIYHDGSEEVLSNGVVHMINTSFPIGGKSTHAIISGHTAFPGKIFFDRLVDVKVGDSVYITVLAHIYAYKVCDIYVVLPEDVEKYNIEPGKDLVTLLTCTPYSINTHRLLVRAERDTESEKIVNAKEENGKKNKIEIHPTSKLDILSTAFFALSLLVFFSGLMLYIISKKKGDRNESKV